MIDCAVYVEYMARILFIKHQMGKYVASNPQLATNNKWEWQKWASKYPQPNHNPGSKLYSTASSVNKKMCLVYISCGGSQLWLPHYLDASTMISWTDMLTAAYVCP